MAPGDDYPAARRPRDRWIQAQPPSCSWLIENVAPSGAARTARRNMASANGSATTRPPSSAAGATAASVSATPKSTPQPAGEGASFTTRARQPGGGGGAAPPPTSPGSRHSHTPAPSGPNGSACQPNSSP